MSVKDVIRKSNLESEKFAGYDIPQMMLKHYIPFSHI